RQGAGAGDLPHAAASARLARALRRARRERLRRDQARAPPPRPVGPRRRRAIPWFGPRMSVPREPNQPLIVVSNRGPAEFHYAEDGARTVRRGGGGLVTALSGLVSHRKALWIASAMTDAVVLVESDPVAYDRFYNVIANPILWFIQHYLWDLSNAPDIRIEEMEAWERGYKVVNADIAAAVLRALEGEREPLVMLHDYHLYT